MLALGAGKMQHKGKEHVLSICGAPEESLKVQERLDALLARGSGTIAVGFWRQPRRLEAGYAAGRLSSSSSTFTIS